MPKQAPSETRRRRKLGKDSVDVYGVRGAGASWQADFGMALNEADLLFAVRREPVANRIVFQVAQDVFDKWFRVEEVSEKPDAIFDREVQRVLRELNAKAIFTEMAIYERLFGWAIVALTYVDFGADPSVPVSNPTEIRELIAYSSLQFGVQGSDEDKDVASSRFGLPVYYSLRRGGSGQQVKLHYTRAIHCATRLLDHPYRGMSALESVYDDLTVLRNIRWGLGQTIFRYGSGFPDITIKGGNKKDLDDLEQSQQLRNLQARTYFVHSDKTLLDFKGANGKALNPEPYYTPILENIAAGSGVPLAILRGAQAGALAGSEVNEREYFKLISDAQSRYEPAVRQLIDALIECGQVKFRWNARREYRIVWLGGAELSEKDKAGVELQQAQARNLKLGWMTLDEVRAEQGLDPLPDGGGKKVSAVESVAAAKSASEASADAVGFVRSLLRFRRKKDAEN